MSELVDDDIQFMLASKLGSDLQQKRGWNVKNFSHNYVDDLTEEIIKSSREVGVSKNEEDLTCSVVKYYLKSNCISDAVDLCLEIQKLDLLSEAVNQISGDIGEYVEKIASYLTACADYLSDQDDLPLLHLAIKLYTGQKRWLPALVLILKLCDENLLVKLFAECDDPGVLAQMSLIVARQSIYYPTSDPSLEYIMSNRWRLNTLSYCTKELELETSVDLREASYLKAIASRLENPRSPRQDTRTMRLRTFFVANGLANCASGEDPIFRDFSPNRFRRRYGPGVMSTAVASMGLVHLWNAEGGYNFYKSLEQEPDDRIQAGLCLSALITRTGIRLEDDLLDRFSAMENKNWEHQVCSIIGLGSAYAGSGDPRVVKILEKVMTSEKVPLILKGLAGISTGLVFVGKQDTRCSELIIDCLAELDAIISRPESLVTCWFLSVGIGLCFLGKKVHENSLTKRFKKLESENLRDLVELVFTICSFAGSGNVLKVQELIKSAVPYKKQQELGRKDSRKCQHGPKRSLPAVLQNKPVNPGDPQPGPSGLIRHAPRERKKEVQLTELNSLLEIKGLQPPPTSPAIQKFKTDDYRSRSRSCKRKLRIADRKLRYVSLVESTDSDQELGPVEQILRDPLGMLIKKQVIRENLRKEAAKLFNSLDKTRQSSEPTLPSGPEKEKVQSLSRWAPLNVIQSFSVLGIALVALGEPVGQEMAHRMLQQILVSANFSAKHMVPLAFALLNASNPDFVVLDILGRMAQNHTTNTASNAILAAGLIGAGTLNGRVVNMLKAVTSRYEAGPATVLNAAILSSGLLQLGRGLLHLSPFHLDGQLMTSNSLAGLVLFSVACLDARSLLLGRLHHLLFYLTPAFQPRYVITVSENTFEPVQTTLRVGKTVDRGGHHGKAKIIAGDRVHLSPIVLGVGEKAEGMDEKLEPLTPYVEDVVLVRNVKEL